MEDQFIIFLDAASDSDAENLIDTYESVKS